MIRTLYHLAFSSDRKLYSALRNLLGFYPSNITLYHLAFSHRSLARENEAGIELSNERLEYLGDSVLGMIVAEYLFKKYPFKDEGFLTEIRSRIVNRESLNILARKIGLEKLIEFDGQRIAHNRTSMYGDAMEALICGCTKGINVLWFDEVRAKRRHCVNEESYTVGLA